MKTGPKIIHKAFFLVFLRKVLLRGFGPDTDNEQIVSLAQCQVNKALLKVSEKCVKKTDAISEHNFTLVFIYSVASKLTLILIITHSYVKLTTLIAETVPAHILKRSLPILRRNSNSIIEFNTHYFVKFRQPDTLGLKLSLN